MILLMTAGIEELSTPMASPTARTLTLLRRCRYVADVVERYLHHARRKRDFQGIADVLAVRRGEPGTLAIQATTLAHVRDRLDRCRSRPELAAWLDAGNRLQVWGWFKRGRRWKVKRVEVRAEDLADVVLSAPRPRRPRKGERQRDLFD
jgi:hypothetical protein